MNARVVVIIILACIGIVLYISLPGGEKENSRMPIVFNRQVTLVSPPPGILRKGTGETVERLLDRLTWGTTESINLTIDSLAANGDPAIVAAAAERIDRLRMVKPAAVKVYIDLLAEIGAPEALPVFLDCMGDASMMVSRAAVRALSGFTDPQTTTAIVEQARNAEGSRLSTFLTILGTRTDPSIQELYADLIAERRDLPVVLVAIEGLGNYDNADSRRILQQCLEDGNLDVRTTALKALLRLRDPTAIERLKEMLGHEGRIRRFNGVQLLAETDWLPPLETLLELASDPVSDIRLRLTATLLTHLEHVEGEERQKTTAALQALMRDHQPEVRIKVIEGLYGAGETSVALPYLNKLQRAVGFELAEAVEITTAVLHCPQAQERLEERFVEDSGLTGDDRLAILTGLASLSDPRSIDLFFRVIGGEWKAHETMAGDFPLSAHAAFKVHALGEGVWRRWEEYLREERDPNAVYFYINGIRNLGDVRAAGTLLELAAEPDWPRVLREEALRSFAFLDNLSSNDEASSGGRLRRSQREQAGEMLLEFHRRSEDRELADLAILVFWNYY